ncbi:MAG: hypothetical protein FJW91_06570 [Actinobacteria bacterium]|nr:hypothetical protein [Actinomycetota bacterium]
MSEENKSTPGEGSDSKAKFREALERKKKGGGIRNNNIAGNSKIHGGQTDGGGPKMFRRKSGSA